jgi:protein TonB
MTLPRTRDGGTYDMMRLWRERRDRGERLLTRRAIALILAIAIHLLIILLLLKQTFVPMQQVGDDRGLATFNLSAEPSQDKKKGEKKAEEKKQTEKQETPKTKVTRPREVEPIPVPRVAAPSFLQMSRADMASADIGRLPQKSDSEKADGGSAGGGASAAVQGPGEGPGGVELFDAEWYRRPTHAELSGYLPANAPRQGWGLVACKTVENYHVDNCQVLGESPVGSGFGRAVRLAAWQFMVMPPRVNGRQQVGAWVRIRIDYTQSVATQ